MMASSAGGKGKSLKIYRAPKKPIDEYTSEERRAWLDNHAATAEERHKQSSSFRIVAAICLGAALVISIGALILSSHSS